MQEYNERDLTEKATDIFETALPPLETPLLLAEIAENGASVLAINDTVFIFINETDPENLD